MKMLFEEAKSTPQQPGEKVYHVVNQSYSVDGETGIFNPVGTSGSELLAEYKLVVGPEMYEEKLRTSLNKAGFEMVRTIASPVVAAESVIADEEKEAGVAVVDLGGGTTSIAVYYENVLRFVSVIPFGGNVVTLDIKEGCSILLRQAESLKVQYGAALGDFVPSNNVVTIPGINGWEPKEISFKTLALISFRPVWKKLSKVHSTRFSGVVLPINLSRYCIDRRRCKARRLETAGAFQNRNGRTGWFPHCEFDSCSGESTESPQFAYCIWPAEKAVKEECLQTMI